MIAFTNVSKQYGAQVLFVDASFQINPGEKVGLVGPNGARKTTIFRLITGEETGPAGAVPRVGAGPAAPRRAGQLPRHGVDPLARTVPGRLPGRGAHALPRPRRAQPRGEEDRRDRRRPGAQLHRRLRLLPAGARA